MAEAKTRLQFIDELSSGVEPVARLYSPLKAGFLLVAIGLTVVTAFLVALYGLRAQAPPASDWKAYGISEAGGLLIGFCLALAAGLARLPAQNPRHVLWLGGLGLLLTSAALAILGSLEAPGSSILVSASAGWPCTAKVLLISVPALIIAAIFIRRGAPTSRLRAGLAVAGTAAALGAVALPLVCVHAESFHLLVSHFLLPFFILTAAMALVARWVFRW